MWYKHASGGFKTKFLPADADDVMEAKNDVLYDLPGSVVYCCPGKACLDGPGLGLSRCLGPE